MSPTTKPKYNLTTAEAIVELEGQLANMKTHPRGELKDMDPDTAYEQGYAVAIFDLKHYTGPDPKER